MKKVLLLAVVAGLVSFTSCKKEVNDAANAVENAADATAETAGDVVDGAADVAGDVADGAANVAEGAVDAVKGLFSEVPTFENAELQTWATDLKDAGVKAAAAAKEGNVDAKNEAVSTLTSLAESMMSFKGNPEFAKAQEYYNSVKSVVENL